MACRPPSALLPRAVRIAALGCAVACGARTGLDDYDGASNPGPSSDAGTSADAGADSGDPPVGCRDGRFSLHHAAPAVMFVLDRSQSMRQRLQSGDTRWNTLIDALATTLPVVDDTMEIGALLYPIADSAQQSCLVPGNADLQPALGNVRPLTKLLRNDGPHGSTPTADAVDRAASALLGFRAATRARAMVLATDGEPTCNAGLDGRTCSCIDGRCGNHPEGCLDDVRTASRLATYRDQGLPTYVIGIQDPDNTALVRVLDALALAGGRPKTAGSPSYYAASSRSELELALGTIRDQVGACTFLTTSVPGANGSIVITINGTPVPEGAAWSWSNRANGEILFTAAVCDVARDPSSDLDVDVLCDVPEAGADAGPDAPTGVRDAAIRD